MFPKEPRPQQAKFGEAVPERWRRGTPPFLFPLQPAGTHLEDGLLQVQGGYKDNPVSKDVKEEQPLSNQRKELDVRTTRLGMAGGKRDAFASV